MVRIHPGQLSRGSITALAVIACACVMPIDLGGAIALGLGLDADPSILAGRLTPTSLQRRPEPQASPDSSAIRDQAEDAQERFERIRRRQLPYVRNSGSRPCEERIGRLCLWHEGEDDWEPVGDPPDLVEARDDLLATLAAAADRIPGDEWILGQRIRYLGEAGRWEDAVRIARACGGAAPWWCNVLEGFALHGMGRYQLALDRFYRGLETMDPEIAREWRDPSILLDGEGSDALEDAADEEEWEAVLARVWTLADPLYLVAGNDRESEHYARWTFSKMSDDARNPWGMRWSDDLEEIALRYGWDRGWERVRPDSPVSGGLPSVIGHQLPGGKQFIPPGRVLDDPSQTTSGAWVLEEERPRTTHVPAYAPMLLAGTAQVAVFHRGDSIVVAASTRLPANPDTLASGVSGGPNEDDDEAEGPIPWPQPDLLDGPEQFGIFVVNEAGQVSGATSPFGPTNGDPQEGALHLTVPAGRYLLGVETWAPERGLGGRIRHGITAESIPEDLATLSDIVLLRPGDALPQDLLSALPSMLASDQLEADGQLVLGWEIFGLSARQEDVSFDLSFYKEGEGFFGTLGRWLGFGGREEPLRIVWSEPGPTVIGPWFRSIDVTIPEVEPGEYLFRLSVTTPGREDLVRTRLVEIVP